MPGVEVRVYFFCVRATGTAGAFLYLGIMTNSMVLLNIIWEQERICSLTIYQIACQKGENHLEYISGR